MSKTRKLIALTLALLMGIVLFSSCAGQPVSGNEASSQGSTISEGATAEGNTPTDDPTFKIGFIHTSFSDQLGVMYQKYAQYAADELGCEIIFAEAPDEDTKTSAQQNLIEMGCQGIIMTSCSEAALQRCVDAGVYYIQVGNSISDPALKTFADSCEYYIGSVLVDNYQVGRNMIDALYRQGCRKLAFIEFTPGKVTTMDDRARGMEEAAEEYSDLEVVTVYTGMPNSFAEGAEQVVAAYGSQIDGIASVMANAAIPSAIFSYGLSDQIKYAGVDIQEGTDELLETGTMAYVAGGAFPNAEIAVAMLYNYLNDDPIWDDDQDIVRPLVELKSVEEYNNYMKYFEGDLPCYTGDELKAIIAAYNPEVTMETVRALVADASVESCVKRHEGLIA